MRSMTVIPADLLVRCSRFSDTLFICDRTLKNDTSASTMSGTRAHPTNTRNMRRATLLRSMPSLIQLLSAAMIPTPSPVDRPSSPRPGQ